MYEVDYRYIVGSSLKALTMMLADSDSCEEPLTIVNR
jgi:hypothetical protein